MRLKNEREPRGMAFETGDGSVILTGPVAFGVTDRRADEDGAPFFRVTVRMLSGGCSEVFESHETFESEADAHLAGDLAAMDYVHGDSCWPRSYFRRVRDDCDARWPAVPVQLPGAPEEATTPPTPQ